jgi:hypothetical protein
VKKNFSLYLKKRRLKRRKRFNLAMGPERINLGSKWSEYNILEILDL